MYNVKWANTYERTCSASKQWATAVGSNGNNYHFQYFFAFESTTDCPTVSNGSTRPTGLTSYNCASIIKSVTTETQRNSATSGVGSNHFLRFETRYSPYTDYQKIFKYYKDISYASADPGTGSNITNKVQYVKYREK